MPRSKSLVVMARPLPVISWFKELTRDEQATVQAETAGLGKALLHFGESKLEIGRRLQVIQSVLEPKGFFTPFLRNFHFSQRTAYRYIKGYENAEKMLPPPVLKQAMARGINIIGDTSEKPLGVYTKVIKMLPPPKRANPTAAVNWLNQIEEQRKVVRIRKQRRGKRAEAGDNGLETCFQFVATRYQRLPESRSLRRRWINLLIEKINGLKAKRKARVVPMTAAA